MSTISDEKLEKAKKLLEGDWSLSNIANHLNVKRADLDRALREKYPWLFSKKTDQRSRPHFD